MLSPVSTGIGDYLCQIYHPGIYPGQLSLAILPWVGALSTGDGFGCFWIRNGASEVTTLWRFVNQLVNYAGMFLLRNVL